MIIQINGQLSWEVIHDESNGGWVGYCQPLRLTAEADTWGELAETIDEIINALLRDLLTEGSLDKFLLEHGWRPAVNIPVRMPEEGIRFDFPFHLTQVPANHAAA